MTKKAQFTPVCAKIAGEIYEQLGGRPADEKKRDFNGPKSKPAKDSVYLSFENWWTAIKEAAPRMEKRELLQVRADLMNASYTEGFNEHIEYLNTLIQSK